MPAPSDESIPPTVPERKQTEIQDLPDPAADAADVKGGASLTPCVRTLDPCLRPPTVPITPIIRLGH
jgi:hypothetical protein